MFDGRHSGFATHQAFNLNSVFAIENYHRLLRNWAAIRPRKDAVALPTFSARGSTIASAGPVFYGVAGLGGGFLELSQITATGTQQLMAFRLGGGVDIPIHDSLAVKVDVSRMSFHFNGWKSGVNISTGIVLKISQ